MEGKSKMLDVLVSENLSLYTAARIGTVKTAHGDTERIEITQRSPRNHPCSKFFSEHFKVAPKWINKSKIISEIKGDSDQIPEMRIGNILSGNYLIDNKSFKLELKENFAPDAIGLEMEAAGLAYYHIHNTCSLEVMIVKAVCDFGDGKKHKSFQPTAALLAAECVKHYLSDKTLPESLTNHHRK